MSQTTTPQARGKFWTAGILIPIFLLLLLNSAPFFLHTFAVSGVPDIGEPFDVQEFGKVQLADEENAFTFYRRAVAELKPLGAFPDGQVPKTDPPWADANERVRAWVESNQGAIETFRQGSELSQALYQQPLELRIDTLLPVTQELRSLARLTWLEASRREENGDYAGAWSLYKALLRMSRHSGMHGCIIERLVGVAIQAGTIEPILKWSANPAVDAALLKQALADIRQSNELTVPVSVGFKCEYISMSNAMDDPKLLEVDEELNGIGGSLGRIRMFVAGEPELSRRVFRMIIANQLTQCDLPPWKQTIISTGPLSLFDTDSIDTSSSGDGASRLPPPAKIQQWFSGTIMARHLVPGMEQVLKAHARDEATGLGLETALAVQLYYRERNQYPERLEELVPNYLPQLPSDPFGKSGEPFHYRREPDGALVWSIGPDSIDDDGKIEFPKQDQRGDILFKIAVREAPADSPSPVEAK